MVKKKVHSIVCAPFHHLNDNDTDMIMKCSESVIHTLQAMIEELGLTNNKAIEGVKKELRHDHEEKQ